METAREVVLAVVKAVAMGLAEVTVLTVIKQHLVAVELFKRKLMMLTLSENQFKKLQIEAQKYYNGISCVSYSDDDEYCHGCANRCRGSCSGTCQKDCVGSCGSSCEGSSKKEACCCSCDFFTIMAGLFVCQQYLD